MGLSSVPSTAADVATAKSAKSDAPALFAPSTASGDAAQFRAADQGKSTLVTLNERTVAGVDANDRISIPLAGDGGTDVVVSDINSDGGFPAWTGGVPGDESSSFTMVEVDGVYRASLISPTLGSLTLAHAGGNDYWWTNADVPQVQDIDDAVDPAVLALPEGAAEQAIMDNADGEGHSHAAEGDAAPSADHAVSQRGKKGKKGKKKRKPKVRLLVGYTKAAKAQVGGKKNMKSVAALIVAQTNQGFKTSGAKAKVKLAGVVKAKGKETNITKDLIRLAKPRDGRFDNLAKARQRRKADLVHLIRGGEPTTTCGIAFAPPSPRSATRLAGAGVTYLACVPGLTASHEIGHNFGGQHNNYPGVARSTKMRFAAAFANPGGGYITTMSYYDPCYDAGNYNCVRVLGYSTPKRTFDGLPLAASKNENNAKAITKVAPKVSRYLR